MISKTENISTYSHSNMFIWMLLAFQGGLINVGGLLAAQTFVSHVTGYVSLASLEFESERIPHGLGLLVMLFMFLVGAMVSGVLIDLKIKENKRPQYFIVFGFLFLMTLLIVICGFNNVFGEFGLPLSNIRSYSLVMMLCFVCGVQNGMITLVSKSVVRTTHVTGLVTDLGIGLVRILNQKLGPGAENEGRANLMRIGIIVSFFVGSLGGVPIFRMLHFRGFIFPCLIYASLFAVTSYFQLGKNRE